MPGLKTQAALFIFLKCLKVNSIPFFFYLILPGEVTAPEDSRM